MLPLPVGPVAWTEASGQMSKERGLASLVATVMNAFLIVDAVSHAEPSNNFINKVRELHAALRACWVPPSLAREHMTISVRQSFKQNGEILGVPLIT